MSKVFFGVVTEQRGNRVSCLYNQSLLETSPVYNVATETWDRGTPRGERPAVRSSESLTWDWDKQRCYVNKPRWPPPSIATFLPLETAGQVEILPFIPLFCNLLGPQLDLAGGLLAALEDITHFGQLTADTAPTQWFFYVCRVWSLR